MRPTIFFLLLLIGITGWQSTALAEETSVDNVLIVLDGSGSMDEGMGKVSKMEAAKAALHQVVDQISPTTHIGLLVFSAKGVKDEWIYPLGMLDKGKLNAAIDKPRPGGGTPLGEYIKLGADRLLKERDKQHGYGTYRLLVITDGEAGDADLVDKYVPEIINRGIVVDAIGVGMARDHTLATKVNSYRRADDPSGFKQVIKEVFAEIGGSKDPAVDAQAFALIAPLSTEIATTMLQTMSQAGNYPIGEKPPVAQPAAQQAATATGGSQPTDPTSGGAILAIGLVTILCMIALVFFVGVMNAND